MRASFDRAVAALIMGRSRKAAVAEVAAAFALFAVLWIAACAFAALEPTAPVSQLQQEGSRHD